MNVRRSKLVCTLGPSCDPENSLEQIIRAGMDVARLNFSHGTHPEHGKRFRLVREVSERCGKPVAILQDLCGPKIRTGTLIESFDLEAGTKIDLFEGSEGGTPGAIPIQYEGLAEDVRLGDKILFDDGRLVLEVLAVRGDRVEVNVVQGGGMRSRIGVHLPSKTMRLSALTEKDRRDLAFGLSLGVDYIALSFVRRPEDLHVVRAICKEFGASTPIIAKIETPDAVENLDAILEASDGAMVARGDLGVEFPPEHVPVIQRKILDAGRRTHRPIIVATEMLQSMTKSSRPTRAEASDVANAVYSGTDCLMLSGETATGDHPVTAVEMMSRIALEAEASPFYHAIPTVSRSQNVAEAVALGAVNTAREIGAKYMVAFTESGTSAVNVSLARPDMPILAYSPNIHTLRRMALLWGTIPRAMPEIRNQDTLVEWVNSDILAANLASPGDRVVLVFGAPIGVPGSTNSMRAHVIG